jgi:hypothetical protein
MFALTSLGSPEPNDSTYNGLPQGDRKIAYKSYLLGLKPSDSLLKINPNPKVWSDIGHMYKTLYDLNLPDKTTNYVPNTFCIKIDSPAVISYASQYDCRSNSSASPTIVATSGLGFSMDNTTIGIVVGVVLLIAFCASSMCAMMIMMKKGKK